MSLKRIPILDGGKLLSYAHLAFVPSSGLVIPPEMSERCKLLNPNHQVPYVLSRLAASAALTEVVGSSVLFVGSRHHAQRYGAFLSLAHEDLVGAAVACKESFHASFGIDVVDIQHLERVARRFPRFAARLLPRCDLASLTPTDVLGVRQTFGEGLNPTSVVLAGHWGLRECCVKLVGIDGRSFPFECFRGPSGIFPEQFEAHMVGKGRDALRSAALCPDLLVSVKPERVELPGGGVKPYLVVVAACNKHGFTN
uniref:Uncharacterized protein TCIL3000_11_14370 n=1 Tax=Trypanosoma congolense (strain IL3000) TaxID=1068625 RepID=G0V2Q0_TRYCI|nr:unnamed protein product [Trypanosoma congolense IL3000]